MREQPRLTNSPYHTWNIGGAWDHIFTPNLILEVRGGVNFRPVQINPTNSLGTSPIDSTFGKNLTSAQQAFLNQTAGFYVASLSGYASTIGNVGTELRANPESDEDVVLTWIHGKHNIKIGGSYLYENRLESNNYLQFNYSNTQTCPLTTSSAGAITTGSNFSCSLPTGGTAYSGFGNSLASALIDLPSSFGANLPQFEEIHATMTAAGGFIQDSWHIRPNLTINIGLRYDFDFPVTFIGGNGVGETINAFDYQTGQYIIGSAETSAYTTGCGNPVVPPCVPNGLSSSNPVFEICTGATVAPPATAASCTAAGGTFFDTTKNITFTGGPQAGLQSIKDNIQPRIGHCVAVPAEHGLTIWVRNVLRYARLSRAVCGERAARFDVAVYARRTGRRESEALMSPGLETPLRARATSRSATRRLNAGRSSDCQAAL